MSSWKPPVDRIHDLIHDHRGSPEYFRSYSFAVTLTSILHSLNDERAAWRQCACAAMAAGDSEHSAASAADEMLRLERARFEPKEES